MHRLKPILETTSTVLVIIAAGALLWSLYRAPTPRRMPGARPPVESVSGLSIAPEKTRHVRGRSKLVLVEFADFECPFCARHAQTTAPTIKKELLDSGRIEQVFFNFPLPIHLKAQKAGEAAECAAQQGMFWEMHERLFKDPTTLDVANLLLSADAVGLDSAKFAQCLKGGATAQHVQADLEEGKRLGVASTPAFFLGTRQTDGSIRLVKRINGAVPFESFNDAIRGMSSE